MKPADLKAQGYKKADDLLKNSLLSKLYEIREQFRKQLDQAFREKGGAHG
jgi:hypothetical protein